MPITLTVNHQEKTTSTVASGPITMDDIREHLFRERDQGGLPYRELIDATAARPLLTTADARATVDLLKLLGREGKLGPTAVVVPNETSYGLVRMVEILLEGIAEVRPFRANEIPEAREWLDRN